MELDVGAYEPLPVRRGLNSDEKRSLEKTFWSSFKNNTTLQEVGTVSHVAFCQQQPHTVAVTSSTRVLVYDARNRKLQRTYARFKDKAYCGTFRADGKLLLAGGEEGILQVFNADGRTLLRQLKGHQQAVHVAYFSQDRLHIFSAGDDATARYWDLASGEQLQRLVGHTDYIRAAVQNPASPSIWATGGYDHMCKVWSVDTGEELMTLDHGFPVEALVYHPTGAMLISGGGTEIRVWSMLSRGQLVTRLDNFVKTVTALHLYQPVNPSAGTAGLAVSLLTGSLDGNLRVFNLDTFVMEFMTKYPNPILSVAVSRHGGHLVAGMSDGSWSIRTRKQKPASADLAGDAELLRLRRQKPGQYMPVQKFLNRGASEKAGSEDFIVSTPASKALQLYDKRLRTFQFRDALDAALQTADPYVVAVLLEELACRRALRAGLGGRTPEGLVMLLEFCSKYMAHPQFSGAYVGTLHRLLNLYTTKMGRLPLVVKALQNVQLRIHNQLNLLGSLQSLKGYLKPIKAAHQTSIMEGF